MTQLLQLWVLSRQDASYYALVTPAVGVDPRKYAPDDKRKLGLKADGLGYMTFRSPGLLAEGSQKDLVDFIRIHPEIIATKDQRDEYYRSKRA